MKIELKRYSHGDNDTLGLLFIDCEFVGYVLEDEYRAKKVYANTRIPEGSYKIKLRKEGGFHNRYLNMFGEDFHKGMLELQDVPNFNYILIHIGNDHEDTAGCLLVGSTANFNKGSNGFVGGSKVAYKKIYPMILNAIEAGDDVTITIENL